MVPSRVTDGHVLGIKRVGEMGFDIDILSISTLEWMGRAIWGFV